MTSKITLIALLTSTLSFSHAADSKMKEALIGSRLSQSCQNKFTLIADKIIGVKKHRILEKNISQQSVFSAFVLISYNDQETHVMFTVMPSDKTECSINYTESYEITDNCQSIRNSSAFKRWTVLGKLTNTTLVLRYDYPRNKAELIADENARANAFLTQTNSGKSCMISKMQFDVPIPPQETN